MQAFILPAEFGFADEEGIDHTAINVILVIVGGVGNHQRVTAQHMHDVESGFGDPRRWRRGLPLHRIRMISPHIEHHRIGIPFEENLDRLIPVIAVDPLEQAGQDGILRPVILQPFKYHRVGIAGDTLEIAGKFPGVHHLLGGIGGEKIIGLFRRVAFDQILFPKTVAGGIDETDLAHFFLRDQISLQKEVDQFLIPDGGGGDHLLIDLDMILPEQQSCEQEQGKIAVENFHKFSSVFIVT